VPILQGIESPRAIGTDRQAERGIILVTGSTGCGKSSTLAAMVEYINENEKCHIITLEDPIEYIFEDNQSVIEQREVGLDTLSFERALVHVMRQDPDVIMIGEMRDSQSFMAALAAADTGHLVITTLAYDHRLLGHRPHPRFLPAHERDQIRRQIAGTPRAVVCQRLTRPSLAALCRRSRS
jgi:twitching motility protein PilT